MGLDNYLRFAFALVLVIGLIAVVAWLARRFGLAPRISAGRSKRRRLSIIEVCPIDGKRRLVLVRRDEREHLILLGINGDLVVERQIEADSPRFDVTPANEDSDETDGLAPPTRQRESGS